MSGPGEHEEEERPEPAAAVSIRARAIASPLTPMMTAPLSVDRAPTASGGPSALAVALNETLRKSGLGRGLRVLRRANQAGGFVCPGCAWPAPQQPTRLATCETGVRAIIDDFSPREAGPTLFASYTIPELARRSDHWLTAQGRLTHPMIRRPSSNGYEPIAWDEALTLVGEALRGLAHPDRALFYGSARIASETAYCLQLLARARGTNNIVSSSQLSHAGSREALRSVLGSPRSPVTLADFDRAEAIFVFGLNPGSNHPRMLETLRAAKLRGAAIVAVNPLREVGLLRVRDPKALADHLGSGTALADLDLRVRVGGDRALLEGMCKAVLEADATAPEFLAAHTEGLEDFAASIAARSWAEICDEAGVDEVELRRAADIYIRSQATIACWGLGLTQQRGGVETIELLLRWLLLRGNVDKPGAGPLAVLGHANTAGCWAVGLEPNPDPALLDALAESTGLEIPRAPGPSYVDALMAMQRGEIDVLLAVGGNLLSSAPDTERVAEGLRRCKLTVQLGTKLNRSHLITGETGLLLPCLSRSEIDAGFHASLPRFAGPSREAGAAGPQWSSFIDATGMLRASQGCEKPRAASLRAEVEILAGIAAVACPDTLDWRALAEQRGRIRELIAALPDCEGFATCGPTTARPMPTRVFTAGKAKLAAPARPVSEDQPGPGLWLTTVRSHDQHNSTVYTVGDRERGLQGYRRVLLMNVEDMQRLGIEPYAQVDLTAHHRGEQRSAPKWVAIPHHVRAGCAAAYWPEANVLIPLDREAVDPRSGTPIFKSVWVTIVDAATSNVSDSLQRGLDR